MRTYPGLQDTPVIVFVPLRQVKSPDCPRDVSSGQLSFTRPVPVLAAAVDDACAAVQAFGLFISVDISAVPLAVFVPITPGVRVHPVVDVARVLPAVPPPADNVRFVNPVTVLAIPGLPVTVPPDALEKDPIFVAPPEPTTIVIVAAAVNLAVTCIVPPTPPCA